MPKYQTQQITTIQGYVDLVDKEKQRAEAAGNQADMLFRGQRRDWPLLPKLARFKLRGEIGNIEKLILIEFQRMSPALTEFRPEDDWDRLALAQHYGLPTRLLDWTYNAIAGLWFAVRQPPSKDKQGRPEYGVVWILKPEDGDFRTDTTRYGPRSNRITKVFRPKVISKRITVQASAFTVHKINRGGRVVVFENHSMFSHKLIKVQVPPHEFSSIRHRLDMLGINESTMFPDLSGLCSHLTWRYSYYEDETKRQKKLVLSAETIKSLRTPTS